MTVLRDGLEEKQTARRLLGGPLFSMVEVSAEVGLQGLLECCDR